MCMISVFGRFVDVERGLAKEMLEIPKIKRFSSNRIWDIHHQNAKAIMESVTAIKSIFTWSRGLPNWTENNPGRS